MSHFGVTVIVEPDTKDIEARVAELMAPFDENDEWFKDGSRWDYYTIYDTVKWLGGIPGTLPIRELPENAETYCVLTPDGKWHERARVGWFGGVATDEDGNSEEKAKDAWRREWTRIVTQYAPDHIAVIVDCHV